MDLNRRFDFDFVGEERGSLLEGLEATFAGALGDEPAGAADQVGLAAARLMRELRTDVARFGAQPDAVEVVSASFPHLKLAGDLQTDRFRYWLVRFPVILTPIGAKPFSKLQCAVEFNPGVENGHDRPLAHAILPDRKFKDLMQVGANVQVRLGERLEFAVDTGPIAVDLQPVGLPLAVEAGAGVEARVKSGFDLQAGGFPYRMRKAVLDHSPAGSEVVYWKLTDAEFFREEDPMFAVVLKVPRHVTQVRIAAALQASHRPSLGDHTIAGFLAYLGERLARFLRAGAPIEATKVWEDVTGGVSPTGAR